MKVSSRELVYNVRRKLNSLVSGGSTDIAVIDVIATINEAYRRIVEMCIKYSEVDPYYRDSVRNLEVKEKELELTRKDKTTIIARLPPDLYKRLNQVVYASCKDCNGVNKRIIPRIVEEDDLYEALRNPYRKPNFAWEQLLAEEARYEMYIYIEESMKVDKVLIDYYKSIDKLEVPSLLDCVGNQYEDADKNTIVKDVDLDLGSTYISDLIEDVAVMIGERSTSDVQSFQTILAQMMNIKNLN